MSAAELVRAYSNFRLAVLAISTVPVAVTARPSLNDQAAGRFSIVPATDRDGPPARNRRLTRADADNAARLYDAGMSLSAIARELAIMGLGRTAAGWCRPQAAHSARTNLCGWLEASRISVEPTRRRHGDAHDTVGATHYSGAVDSISGGGNVPVEQNGFLEYLQLQGGEPDLVTKSELIAEVRGAGYAVSDRQLTFYVSEELIPRSVRVGSRSGAYPAIVAELLMWILQARDGGVPIEALKELLPVWKFLIRSRKDHALDLGELEYIARQHVTSVEASVAVPRLVSDVMTMHVWDRCRGDITIVFKDGGKKQMSDPMVTVGFAIVRPPEDDDPAPEPRWFASTRLSLATAYGFSSDPTTIILGVKPNATLPADPQSGDHDPARLQTEEDTFEVH